MKKYNFESKNIEVVKASHGNEILIHNLNGKKLVITNNALEELRKNYYLYLNNQKIQFIKGKTLLSSFWSAFSPFKTLQETQELLKYVAKGKGVNFESKNIIFYKYLKNGKEQEAIKYKIDSQKECRITYKLINQLVSGKISITIDDTSMWMPDTKDCYEYFFDKIKQIKEMPPSKNKEMDDILKFCILSPSRFYGVELTEEEIDFEIREMEKRDREIEEARLNRIIDIEFNPHNNMDDEWFYFENPDYI